MAAASTLSDSSYHKASLAEAVPAPPSTPANAAFSGICLLRWKAQADLVHRQGHWVTIYIAEWRLPSTWRNLATRTPGQARLGLG